MTDADPYGSPSPGYTPAATDQPPYFPTGVPAYAPAYPPGYATGSGPVGQERGTGVCILLFVITFGIYGLYWYYAVHEDMKRHTGQGLGGGIALLIAFFVGIVSPFLVSDEVGKLYQRAGHRPPVTALTGLWVAPGFLLLVLPIVWFVKTNGALNDYWRAAAAQRP